MLAEGAFVAAMATAAGFDLAARRVPNRLAIGILVGGLLARAILGGAGAVGWGALGAAAGLGLLILPFAARWMGGGDVKLAAAIGAWLGPAGVAWAVLVGLAGGGLLALATLAAGGPALRRRVGVNLRNAWLSLRLPEVERRPDEHRVPLAVALGAAAIGVMIHAGGLHAP